MQFADEFVLIYSVNDCTASKKVTLPNDRRGKEEASCEAEVPKRQTTIKL